MYDRFAQLLKENNLTCYKVSKDTGIATATLSDWKNEKSVPKVEKLKIISKYFDVSIDWLLGVSDIRQPFNNDESETFLDEYNKLSNNQKETIMKIISSYNNNALTTEDTSFIEYYINSSKKIKEFFKKIMKVVNTTFFE